ncbi:MAG: dienelactone hydrolase family protein [Alphaproteobacteria bacterium]
MAGSYVTVKAGDGGEFKAYVAKPAEGSGPGVVLCQEIFGVNAHIRHLADLYAEEGYVVIAPDLFWRLKPGVELAGTDADMPEAFGYYQKFDVGKGVEDIAAAVKALRAMPECKGKVGAIGFCLGGKLAYLAAAHAGVDCAVSYYGVGIENDLDVAKTIAGPMVLHFAGEDKFVPPAAVEKIRAAFAGRDDVEIYAYPGCDHAFNNPGRASFNKPAALMAHSRSMAMFRRIMGPRLDLSALWDKHCEYEFAQRDVPKTMATMVAEPYVNHIPTMTGGVGFKQLSHFYQHHFVNSNPADTKLIPISRTIGSDRVVDEMLFCFTHDREIDWMLPNVKPTGKYVEVPLIAIINFRGGKLYNEHIYWDQASVLVQIGLLDPKTLPVSGIEQTKKLLDPTIPSNGMMKNWRYP